jgi:hypothetical protein
MTVKPRRARRTSRPSKPVLLMPRPTKEVVVVEEGVTVLRCIETARKLWLTTKAIAAKSVTRNHDHGRGRVRKSDVVCKPAGVDVKHNGRGRPSA